MELQHSVSTLLLIFTQLMLVCDITMVSTLVNSIFGHVQVVILIDGIQYSTYCQLLTYKDSIQTSLCDSYNDQVCTSNLASKCKVY